MNENRVKVWNDTTFDIGLKDYRGIEYNIKPHSFNMFSEDDIAYFVSIARSLFDEPHKLRIEKKEVAESCGVEVPEESVIDKAYIRKNLSQSVAKVHKYLDDVEDPYLLSVICDVANEMDLPNSKMKILMEKCPEKFDV